MSTAKMKNVSISPQKVRLLARQMKGLNIQKALDQLSFSKKKCSFFIKKILNSAIANAEHNDGSDIDELFVEKVFVERGTKLRRFAARAKGRGDRIEKPTCHIFLTVGIK